MADKLSLSEEQISSIVKAVHPKHKEKQYMWTLLNDSYSGGQVYQNGNYLHKFTLRESTVSYDERRKRAIYFNYVQPLVDLLVGFLFTQDISREEVKQQEIIDNAGLDKGMQEFMQELATHSFMYTTGILIDSPQYDPEIINSESSRIENNLHPYAVYYNPVKIRNWFFDKYGVLKWVLLDNSSYDNSDPFIKGDEKKSYRLWTENEYVDFEEQKDGMTSRWIQKDAYPHPVGRVPFRFHNMYSGKKISDTIFEDIALIAQSIYNYNSLMDEMISGGTFKFLFYPGDLPPEVKSDGFSNFAAIPFDAEGSKQPFFDGPKLDDMQSYISAINFLTTEILRKLGLNTDNDKNYVQSGAAKFYDYKKVKSLLTSAADSLEATEKWILTTAGKWSDPEIDEEKAKIEYRKDFLGEEEETELARLTAHFAMTSVQEVKSEIEKRMADINLTGLTKSEMQKIRDAIDTNMKQKQEMALNMPDLINQEKNTGEESNDQKPN